MSDNLSISEQLLSKKFLTFLDHKCYEPEHGVVVMIKEEKDKTENLENKFKHMALLISNN